MPNYILEPKPEIMRGVLYSEWFWFVDRLLRIAYESGRVDVTDLTLLNKGIFCTDISTYSIQSIQNAFMVCLFVVIFHKNE